MVTRLAAPLGTRLPRVRDPLLARWIARNLEALLRHIAGGHEAIDLAIGEGLAALDVGRRAMDLGYSNSSDYAREELGINASTAAKMARPARKLADRPLLREAVRRGEVTLRKAEVIAPVARGDDQAPWILRTKAETVRSLKVAVNAPREPDEESYVNLFAPVPPGKQPVLDEGLRLAGLAIGATSTKMQRVKAWCEEFLGSHAAPGDEHVDDLLFAPEDEQGHLKEALEQQHPLWKDLIAVEPLGLASFGHYCDEVLGMCVRAVEQRIALEKSLVRLPVLRQALQEKRLSYEKARLIARHAAPDEVPAWIEQGQRMTCIALRRALQQKEEAQMCARGNFSVWMPVSVAEVVKAAFRAARALAKRFLAAGECLLTLAEHFIQTYRGQLREMNTLHHRILARDKHCCQVPGCSRTVVHGHHIRPRSQGGSDDEWNLISLCAAHHLHGIHGGRMRVTGKAPDELVWEFGLRRSHAETAA